MKHTKFKTNKLTTAATDQTKPKTKRLQKRVSCGVVLMASTMLHEKCCNTVLQIGAPSRNNYQTRPPTQEFIAIFEAFCVKFELFLLRFGASSRSHRHKVITFVYCKYKKVILFHLCEKSNKDLSSGFSFFSSISAVLCRRTFQRERERTERDGDRERNREGEGQRSGERGTTFLFSGI